MGPKWKLEIN